MNLARRPASSLLLGAVIVLIGLNLRPVLASVGPLLSAIRSELPISFTTASLLTTLPVLAMGFACFVGFPLARRLGSASTIGYALLCLALATALRFWVGSSAALLATALLAGMGIAVIQTLIPAVIKANFGERVPAVMGFYVTAIMAGATFAAAGAPLIADFSQWRGGLGHWVWLTLATWLVWTWLNHSRGLAAPTASGERGPRFWKHRRTWVLAALFGLGTGAYVCVLAWLAPFAMEQGYSDKQAGLLLGLLTLVEVVAGLVFPAWASRSRDRRPVLFTLCALQVIGFGGLALAPQLGLPLWSAVIGLGIGGFFPMAMIVTMDHRSDPLEAGKLTAIVQGIGYLVAGATPWISGVIRDQLHSFEFAWLLLVAGAAVIFVLSLGLNPASYQRAFGGRTGGQDLGETPTSA